MPLFDLPLDQLWEYLPDVAEPPDFDDFWADTLTDAGRLDLGLELVDVETGLALVESVDVTFAGFGGHPVKGWLTRPRFAAGLLPAVVEFVGYGGGRGLPHERLAWACAGYAHLVMDTRGQGSMWGSGGDTPDPVGSGPSVPGFLTRGLLDPEDHYYRRVFTDAARAVQAVRSVPGVDPSRVAVVGASQGGGMALAAAALVPDVRAAMVDVPFLCHFRRAVDLSDTGPYTELARYLAVHRNVTEKVFGTLSYVDTVNFARRAQAPALFSVALRDTTCPPSTVFAAFNLYGQRSGTRRETPPKDIVVHEFNAHEGGAATQLARQLSWLGARLEPA